MPVALYTTAETIVAVLAAAVRSAEPVFDVTWTDLAAGVSTQSGSRSVATGQTEVTIMPAPAVSTVRTVRTVVVHNRDVLPVTVTLYMASGTTRSTFASFTLNPGQVKVVDSTGAVTTPTAVSSLGTFEWMVG